MDLRALGESSYGVCTCGEALRLLTAGAVDERVRSGTWQVLWRGVHADAGRVPDAEQRAVAAVLAVGGRRSGHVLRAVPVVRPRVPGACR